MARKEEKRTIDGASVSCLQLPVTQASIVFKRLIGLFAAAASGGGAALISKMEEAKQVKEGTSTPQGGADVDLSKMPIKELAGAILAATKGLEDDDQRALERQLLSTVFYNGISLADEGNVTVHVEDIGTYYKILMFAIEVNFAHAFRGPAAAMLAQVAGKAQVSVSRA